MGNVTLTVDCGGTGIKASVFDQHSKVLVDFPYLKTPYPMSPNSLVEIISNYVLADHRINRVTVGLPGMIRNGKIVFIQNGHTPGAEEELLAKLKSL